MNKPLFQPRVRATPFKFTLVFSLLLMVAAMLAIAVIYFQNYTTNEITAKQRLTQEITKLSALPYAANPQQYLPTDMHAISLPRPLPAHIPEHWTTQPQLVSAANLQRLTQTQSDTYERAWVGLIPQSSHYLAVILPMQPIRLLPLFEVLWYLFLVIMAVMWGYSALINRRTMRRIEQIDEMAQAILQGDLSKRILHSPYQKDEYSQLIKTLNDMLDRIEQLMRDLRQVNQNIAHDLKTPLNRLRSRLELALLQDKQPVDFPDLMADSIEDIDALLATFNALLLLGKLDAKAANYPLSPISLSELLQQLAALYEPLAEEKQQQWQVSIDASSTVFAHQALLSQAISNLLDNAIKYTPEKGTVSLSLTQQGEFAVIRIADNGSGIAETDKATVFEPFSRLDASRHLPGNGLGMSLVLAILNIHRARIELLDNQPGLLVKVYLRVL